MSATACVCSPPTRRSSSKRGRRIPSPRRGGRWPPITNWWRSPASPTRGPIGRSTSSRSADANSRSPKSVAAATPFCELLPFPKERGGDDPKVLLVAPMSGHFATLLRGTIRTLLQRPSGLHHRLDQPAQRQARGGRLRARRLHPAPDRFRPLHRRGLPHRRRLPADGQRADRDRRARRRGRQCPAGEPDADGRADRRAHRADQGQRTRAGKADRMVPRQHDRRRAGAIRGRRAAGLSRLPPALRLHEHERRAPRQILRRPVPAPRRRRFREGGRDQRLLSRNISPSWT